LNDLLTKPRPEHLATSEEQALGAWIEGAEAALGDAADPQAEALRSRVRRLKGLLHFTLETQYHERLTQAHAHLRELERDVARLSATHEAFVRARQAATHGYVGYDEKITRLRERASAALERLSALMARQGQLLEGVAITELEKRRERLEASLNQARFAFADSYDRAAKAQAQ
jgi:chromosome segregation ATPase